MMLINRDRINDAVNIWWETAGEMMKTDVGY
jgi:hypothetical protein